MTTKINKVTTDNVKVNVNQVKPQITYVKRLVSKFLVDNKLAAKGNTATKPEAVKLTDSQSKSVQNVITKGLSNLAEKYSHTTKAELSYIKNHFNTHSMKYLK
jgi:hypothetical protein